MAIETLARKIYSEFRQKPESQHIASEFALIELARLLAEAKPKSVLEVGAGIGTITKLLLTHPDRPSQLTVTENHPVCLRELENNLRGLDRSGFEIINRADQLAVSKTYDLVIFDGTLDEDRQYQLFQPGTWLFVEGGRGKTINTLRQSLEARGLGLAVERRTPQEKSLKLLSKRKVLGIRLPAFKFKPAKGCSIGRVTAASAA